MSNAKVQSVVHNAQPVLTLSGHTDTIRTMAYLPCGQRLVTGASDKTVRVWRVGDGSQEGSPMVHETAVWRLAVTSDGNRIVSNDHDGRVTVWDVESHQLVEEWKHKDKCPRVAVSPNGRFVACGSRAIDIRDITNSRAKHEIRISRTLTSLSYSPDGNKLACGMSAGVVEIYDVQSHRRIVELNGHADPVYDVSWSHDGDKLYSASKDQTIRCWSYGTGEQIGGPWTGHTGCVYTLSLSPDGTRLASGSNDKTVRLWDTATGHPIGRPLPHSKGVWAVSVSPSNDFVAAGGSNNKVFLWRVSWWNDTKLTQPTPVSANKRGFTSTPTHSPTRTAPPNLNLRFGNTDHSPSRHIPKVEPRSPTISSVVIPPRNGQLHSSELEVTLPSSAGPLRTAQFINEEHPDQPHEPTSRENVEPQAKQNTVTLQRAQSPPIRRHHSANLPATTRHLILSRAQSTPAPTALFSHKHKADLQSFPAPPDLTPHIVRLEDQYHEGGSFADVYNCLYNSSSGAKEVAVKAFRFNFTIEAVRRELGIWKRLEHPNIVPFLGTTTGFGRRDSVSTVSLWMPNRTLHKFLESHNEELNIGHRLQMLSDIANGLDYLHSYPIIHGDLSGNNVLLDESFTARLVDFGLSSFVGSIPQGLTYLAGSTASPGTLRWSAPEQHEETYKRTPKSDIYSFGCISLQALSGKLPWSEFSQNGAILKLMIEGQNPSRPESLAIEDVHWEFIQTCWAQRVEDRPTANMLVSSLQEFLSSCPQFPSLRDMFALTASLSASNE